MRKRLITPIRHAAPVAESQWLELDRAAAVEVTSEETQHPIEGALVRMTSVDGERRKLALKPCA